VAALARHHDARLKKSSLSQGDRIIITRGDLRNLTGHITAVQDDRVSMKPDHTDLTDIIDFQLSDVRKFFAVGDHVKAMAGPHAGETGMIVRVVSRVNLLALVCL
jgi:transcription elongation factor SPT5